MTKDEIIRIHFHICPVCDCISTPDPDMVQKYRPCSRCNSGTVYCIIVPIRFPV